MRRPVIATSFSAIALFTAGVVAGQLGGLPLSSAANTPGVGANAGVAPVANGSVTTNHKAFNEPSSAKATKVGAHATAGRSLSSSPTALTSTSRTPRLRAESS